MIVKPGQFPNWKRLGKTETELEGSRSRKVKSHRAPSLIPRREPASPRAWGPALTGAGNAKLYSKQKYFKLTVESKESHHRTQRFVKIQNKPD
jgi:hypothetical protein